MAKNTGSKKKRKGKKDFPCDNFREVLDLPPRLVQVLCLLFHANKDMDWDPAIEMIRQGKAYREYSKSKGPGKGLRHFGVPCDELKELQKKILMHFLGSVTVHFCRHGVRGTSIITNAEHHQREGDTSLFSVDLVNAFPTVFRSRMQANFSKPLRFRLKEFGEVFNDEDFEKLLVSIVDLVCLHDSLPQGPPTSPRILDIVCRKMDIDLTQLCRESTTGFIEYRYTAYFDDLSISANQEIPEDFRQKVVKIIRKNGFHAHERKDKCEYFSPESGKVATVTGLVINRGKRITMAPKKADQIRARLHNALSLETWDFEVQGVVNGLLGFVDQVYHGGNVPSKLRKDVHACRIRLVAHHVGISSAKGDSLVVDLNDGAQRQVMVDRIVAESIRLDNLASPDQSTKAKTKKKAKRVKKSAQAGKKTKKPSPSSKKVTKKTNKKVTKKTKKKTT